jgi:hypothetical protein
MVSRDLHRVASSEIAVDRSAQITYAFKLSAAIVADHAAPGIAGAVPLTKTGPAASSVIDDVPLTETGSAYPLR